MPQTPSTSWRACQGDDAHEERYLVRPRREPPLPRGLVELLRETRGPATHVPPWALDELGLDESAVFIPISDSPSRARVDAARRALIEAEAALALSEPDAP